MPRNKNIKTSNPTPSKPRDVLIGKPEHQLDTLDLIEVQKVSWAKFLGTNLQTIISEFFPVDDYTTKKFTLYYEGLYFGDPRYTIDVCINKKLTFDIPVYVKLKIVNKKTGTERKQDVYFFNLPRMTEKGTFIINGIERVVINQLVRAPGVFFTAVIDKTTGLTLYNAELRPYIGAWLDITINKNNLIEIKINKKRKFLSTTLIKAFDGESKADILNHFKDMDKELVEKYILPTLNKDTSQTKDDAVLEIYKKVKPGEPLILENAYETLTNLFFNPRRYSLSEVGRYKINKKLGLNLKSSDVGYLLTKTDIIETIKYLISVAAGKGKFDDIDHLGNRRLRTVGELVGMYGIRVGMVRAEREIKERMSLITADTTVHPSQIVN